MSGLTDEQKVEAYIRELLAVPAPDTVTDYKYLYLLSQIQVRLQAFEILRRDFANPVKDNGDCPF